MAGWADDNRHDWLGICHGSILLVALVASTSVHAFIKPCYERDRAAGRTSLGRIWSGFSSFIRMLARPSFRPI
jgi:hypothetical protein